jgi:hypothetical protein
VAEVLVSCHASCDQTRCGTTGQTCRRRGVFLYSVQGSTHFYAGIQETTLFDEKQFEAYRELGFQLTHQMLEDLQQGKVAKDARQLQSLLGLTRSSPTGQGWGRVATSRKQGN